MDKYGYKIIKLTECHASVFKLFLSLNRDKESTFSISVKSRVAELVEWSEISVHSCCGFKPLLGPILTRFNIQGIYLIIAYP